MEPRISKCWRSWPLERQQGFYRRFQQQHSETQTMKLFTAIYNDAKLLGSFLRHYDQYGITEFLLRPPRALHPWSKVSWGNIE
jgi:hypothetical protein